MKRKSLTIALIVVGICTLGVISASAQSPFSVNYFANNGVSGAPDATVRITNPGSSISGGTGDSAVSNGDLCAMIYVFDNDQQMDECCGCLITPDGLLTLSVTNNLTSNPLVGTVVNHGDIKIISAFVNDSPCDPTTEEIAGNLRSWATHIENKVGTAYPITETAFSDAQISLGEFENLQVDCYFITRLGSGHGVCNCGLLVE